MNRMIGKTKPLFPGILIFLCFLLPPLAHCLNMEPSAPLPEDITTLSIEQIMGMDVEVTSVTKRTKSVMETPSSVVVITGEDIRRSGATTLSDLLALVPGYNVSQITSQAFQSSKNSFGKFSQGFHGPVSTSLLILKDGKSILSNVTSINWSQTDLGLEDIDRIEVIRGAAAPLWGSNAVNGVVNIITKNAADTHGILVSGEMETDNGGASVVRYGGAMTDAVDYRVYAKYFEDRFALDDGDLSSRFSFDVLRSGFRIDQKIQEKGSLLYMGEVYTGDFNFRSFPNSFIRSLGKYDINTETGGGSFFMRYAHAFSNRSDLVMKLSVDRVETDFTTLKVKTNATKREDIGYGFYESIVNLDVQHEYRWKRGQAIVWGGELQCHGDGFDTTYYMHVAPESQKTAFESAFLQAETPLLTDHLFLTLGANLSHNDTTGMELQPSCQLLFQPGPKESFWVAASRSVRIPSRLEKGMYMGVIAQRLSDRYYVCRFYGNPELSSEDLISTEMGFRFKPSDTIFFDATFYYNTYDHIIYFTQGDIKEPVDVNGQMEYEIPFYLTNQLRAEAYGGEIALEWRLNRFARLKTYYAYLEFDLDLSEMDQLIRDFSQVTEEDPKHEICVQSFLDLTDRIEFNTRCRYMGELSKERENSHFILDAQLRYKISKNSDFYLYGKNLTGSNVKFVSKDSFEAPTVDDTSIVVKIEWRL